MPLYAAWMEYKELIQVLQEGCGLLLLFHLMRQEGSLDYLRQFPGPNFLCPYPLTPAFLAARLLSRLLFSLFLVLPSVVFLPPLFSFEPLWLASSELLPVISEPPLLTSFQPLPDVASRALISMFAASFLLHYCLLYPH